MGRKKKVRLSTRNLVIIFFMCAAALAAALLAAGANESDENADISFSYKNIQVSEDWEQSGLTENEVKEEIDNTVKRSFWFSKEETEKQMIWRQFTFEADGTFVYDVFYDYGSEHVASFSGTYTVQEDTVQIKMAGNEYTCIKTENSFVFKENEYVRSQEPIV